MEDVKNGVQVIDEPVKDVTPVVQETGVETQPAPEKKEEVKDEQKVPLSRFNEVNERMKIAEQQAQMVRDQMMLMQANQTQQTRVQTKDFYEQLGLKGDDYPTVEQQRQIDNWKAEQNRQQQLLYANQQYIQTRPDYSAVVGQVNPVTGQFMASAELQKLLMEKPYLYAAATSSAQGAYEILMQERKLAELNRKTAALEQHQITTKVDDKLAPMSPASAGGGGTTNSGSISRTAGIKEVKELERRVKAGEFG